MVGPYEIQLQLLAEKESRRILGKKKSGELKLRWPKDCQTRTVHGFTKSLMVKLIRQHITAARSE